MRSRVSRISLLGIVLLLPSAAWTQQAATAPVTIQVCDPTGATVAHADIRLLHAPDLIAAKFETNHRGYLSLNLKAGGYALVVNAQGFKRWSERIFVANANGDPSSSQIVQVVLQVGEVGSPTVYAKNSLVLTANAFHDPVALSPADFRALPHTTITVHNAHTNADETYSGVLLATLLARINAPVGDALQKDALTNYVIASGSDGYSVVLSLAEVDSSFHGGRVLVADARDGQPLAKSGPFQLIVSEDKPPARWVHQLTYITLEGIH
jgi:hypothetical protein